MVAVTEAIGDTDGVASVSGPIPNTLMDPALDRATAVLWQVQPETSPQDEATTVLVQDLRDEVLPSVEPAGVDVLVTGSWRSPWTSRSTSRLDWSGSSWRC
ncbi:MAG: hypothetical protein R2716_10710 [Microthrixaceae bacterium]